MTRARPLLACLLLLALAAPGEARDRREGAPTEPVGRALAKLESPLARDREAGVEELVALLPGARERIIEALPKASWEVRASLIQVLARDGSDAALRALLDVLVDADDAQAAAAFLRIASDEATAKRLLTSLRKDRARFGDGSRARMRRLDTLHGLLLRAEIEDKFISRKSRTGSTGYYRGQYDVLEYARTEALEVVMHIAMDQAIRVPGVYRTGPYQFLRPQPIDFWEIREMAVNAIGELARPGDKEILAKLDAYARRLVVQVERTYREIRLMQRNRFRFDIDPDELDEMREDFGILVGRYGDVVTARFLILRDPTSEAEVRAYIESIERRWSGALRWGEQSARSMKASTLIRAGWYAEAVQAYQRYLQDWISSKSTGWYNIACAYASWSLDPGLSEAEKKRKRDTALKALERAVDRGWTDLGWMDEDGDLNPIRDTPQYRALVDRIKRELGIK